MMMMMIIIIIIIITRTTLNRFLTKNCHTRNITHHKESAQEEKHQGRKKTCDKK
jgi:uncharacterized membrane protein affecting hemolysin expression